jgi:hypothetical protein
VTFISSQSRTWLAVIPAVAAAAALELFLGHRHDYAGHFLAGYGGTLGAFMFCARLMPARAFLKWSVYGNLPVCLICILLGVCAEATIFRIAKFDELDFCNQSLGAALAAIVALGYTAPVKPSTGEFDRGLIVAIAFLGAGGIFAVA